MNLTMPWKAQNDARVNGVGGKLDDVRRTLSHEAEHLAHVAAKYGREATSQAARLADDVADQASKVARDASTASRDSAGSATGVAQSLLKNAAEIGSALAVTGRRTAAEVTQDAKAVADDLKKVRITTEPRKTGPDFMPGITLLGGFGAGIALMYFLDPEQGRRRRVMLRDRLTKWTRIAGETFSGRAKDLSNRAVGAAHEMRKTAAGGTVATTDQPIVAASPAWEPSYGTAPTTEPAAEPTIVDGSPWGSADPSTTVTAPTTVGGSPWGSTGSTDPSTTDTWGEQPQANEEQQNPQPGSTQQSSRTEIS
jgi:hypothetical protein